jgi:gliding motility-associated-like protein
MIRRTVFCVLVLVSFLQVVKAGNVIVTLKKDSVCTGTNVNLKGSVALGTVSSWKWAVDSIKGVSILPNDSTQNITINFTNSGTYIVTLFVNAKPGGLDSQKVTITVIQRASALFATSGVTAGIPQTVNFINTSANAPNGFTWNFGDYNTLTQSNLSNVSHTYNAASAYTVSLIAYGAFGCNDTASLPLIVADTAGLSMPNVFTPNGDGINDVYTPNAHGMKSLDCTIYDRWGAKIIDMDLNMEYWDGYTTSGLPCTAGTYFYVIKATDVNSKAYSLKGSIQLIR